jgi:hypothetical protein
MYIPKQGMITVYTDYETIDTPDGPVTLANFKIGTGNNYLINTPFVDEGLRYALYEHINDKVVHITAEEREFWNNKINCIEPEVSDDLLEFTRN